MPRYLPGKSPRPGRESQIIFCVPPLRPFAAQSHSPDSHSLDSFPVPIPTLNPPLFFAAAGSFLPFDHFFVRWVRCVRWDFDRLPFLSENAGMKVEKLSSPPSCLTPALRNLTACLTGRLLRNPCIYCALTGLRLQPPEKASRSSSRFKVQGSKFKALSKSGLHFPDHAPSFCVLLRPFAQTFFANVFLLHASSQRRTVDHRGSPHGAPRKPRQTAAIHGYPRLSTAIHAKINFKNYGISDAHRRLRTFGNPPLCHFATSLFIELPEMGKDIHRGVIHRRK